MLTPDWLERLLLIERHPEVGAARRLKISAKAREVRGVDRVVIRDGEAIAAMLTRLGAHDSVNERER